MGHVLAVNINRKSHSFELNTSPRKWFEARSKDPDKPHDRGQRYRTEEESEMIEIREVSLKNGSRKITTAHSPWNLYASTYAGRNPRTNT
jgi:hypothetical protein